MLHADQLCCAADPVMCSGECLNILFSEGPQSKADCEVHKVTEALEHVIEANILLSGLGMK